MNSTVTVIADTHGSHGDLRLQGGDILIHAGDLTRSGEENEVRDFLEWFAGQDFTHKIFIAGNHDFYFERNSPDETSKLIPPGVVYLQDSMTEANGLKIWGSPVTPWFYNWAFNAHRGASIQKHWNLIPEGTDILVTHGPPRRILDRTALNEHAGCDDLLHRINHVHPRFHVFGHIHESYGTIENSGITFINASVMNSEGVAANAPVVFECGPLARAVAG